MNWAPRELASFDISSEECLRQDIVYKYMRSELVKGVLIMRARCLHDLWEG